MPHSEIFAPFFAMILLTLGVWSLMYVRRTTYLTANRTDLRKVDTPAKMDIAVPDHVNLPAYALKNLFELPVIFYVLCLYLFITENVDQFYLITAWIFVAGRVLHSVIYCTYNAVLHRFLSYLASALALWLMVFRASFAVLFGGET